jgi:hypothetical protein
MTTLIAGDMPFVRVGQVLEYNLRDVELLTFSTLVSQGRHR